MEAIAAATDQEVAMSFPVLCPVCRDELGIAEDTGFAATTCEVTPCDDCAKRTGMVSMTMRKSATLELAEAVSMSGSVHRDGLAVFG